MVSFSVRSVRSRMELGLMVLLALLSFSMGSLRFLDSDAAKSISDMQQGTYNPYKEFNSFVNDQFFRLTMMPNVQTYVDRTLGQEWGYFAQCYLRDLILGSIIYWLTAGIWHIVIYDILGHSLFVTQGRPFPSREVIIDQMQLAQASIFVYAGLPVLSEIFIESGWTQTYFFVDEIGGWGFYALYVSAYLTLVEIGIYWMHRTLHTNKFLYKYVHGLHHKYNKASTLTPWASIAFNPLDGILQASPYVFFLFFVPVHYFTHVGMLFFSGVWATNIHDALWGDTEPIMGSKYHTLHHTHYHYNFGQFFIFCDYIFGTLKMPVKNKSE